MLSIFDRIYCSIRREEVRRLKNLIKSMTIDGFYEVLTKTCWQVGIQYEILVKNSEMLLIKLEGSKRQVIIKFHKTSMVFISDYEKFLSILENHSVQKGIYITTGVFDFKILRKYKKIFPPIKKIILQDMLSFGRKQIGWKKSSSIIFKNNKFELNRYLP